MKRIFTLITLFIASLSFGATPTLDGTINVADGYALISIGNGTAGWSNTNAKNLYFTQDATYYYFAANITASGWMSYGLIINTTASAGGTSDGWARAITYAHTEKPDVEIRGNFNGGYAELHTWNGTSWAGGGSNYNSAGTNIVNTIGSGTDVNGAIEIRILKATIGTFAVMNAQFYITGDQNPHANFDAVPDDNNTTAWSGITTNLSQYALTTNSLPLSLISFTGVEKEKRIELKWSTAKEENVAFFGIEQSTNSREWNTAATVNAKNAINGADYITYVGSVGSKQYLRLKMVDKDGKYTYSEVLVIKEKTGIKLDLQSNMVKSDLVININNIAGTVTAEVYSLNGGRLTTASHRHAGGNGLFTVNVSMLPKGMYVLNVTEGSEKKSFRFIKE